MKHRIAGRTLGRKAHHRRHLMQQLTGSLLEHGSLATTEAKAKELRRWIEPLLTEAKEELTLHRRRRLLSKLGHKRELDALVAQAAAHKKRPGGYVRLTRLATQRTDGAPMMRVELLDSSSS